MKKLILFLSVVMIATISFSQETEGSERGLRRGGGANPRMKEMIKQRIVSELQLTESQADSVTAIQMAFQKNAREVKQNTSLTEDQKKDKMKEMMIEKNKQLKSILTDDQIKKLQEMMENMRNRRQEAGEGRKN